MITIRFFQTRKEVELAKEVLTEGGFYAEIGEDKFYGVPIQKYGVPPRFRLNILASDLERASKFLAGKLKKRKGI